MTVQRFSVLLRLVGTRCHEQALARRMASSRPGCDASPKAEAKLGPTEVSYSDGSRRRPVMDC